MQKKLKKICFYRSKTRNERFFTQKTGANRIKIPCCAEKKSVLHKFLFHAARIIILLNDKAVFCHPQHRRGPSAWQQPLCAYHPG